jgi:hypothetical protein
MRLAFIWDDLIATTLNSRGRWKGSGLEVFRRSRVSGGRDDGEDVRGYAERSGFSGALAQSMMTRPQPYSLGEQQIAKDAKPTWRSCTTGQSSSR